MDYLDPTEEEISKVTQQRTGWILSVVPPLIPLFFVPHLFSEQNRNTPSEGGSLRTGLFCGPLNIHHAKEGLAYATCSINICHMKTFGLETDSGMVLRVVQICLGILDHQSLAVPSTI